MEIAGVDNGQIFHLMEPFVQNIGWRNIVKAPQQHVVEQAAQLVEQLFARQKARAVFAPGKGPVNVAQQRTHNLVALPGLLKQGVKVGSKHFLCGKNRLKVGVQVEL